MFVTEVHSQKTLIPTDFFKNFKEIYKWYKNQGGGAWLDFVPGSHSNNLSLNPPYRDKKEGKVK